MKTILRYELDHLKKHQDIQMPRNSNILDVQLQDGVPVFWAMVDTDTPMEERRFMLAFTGEKMSADSGYIGYIATFQIGMTVYHLFEEFDELPF